MRAVYATLALLAAMLLVLWLLLFSDAGTRRLIAWAEGIAPVQFEYTSGSLFGQLRLARAELSLEAVDISLSGVTLSLEPGCLWVSEVCFDLAMERGRVAWQGGDWQHQDARLSGTARRDAISIARVELVQGELTLDTADEPGEEAFVPPELVLPLALEIDSLSAQRIDLNINAARISLTDASLAGRWSGADVSLVQLSVSSPELGGLRASGTAQLADGWPLSLDGNIVSDSAALEPIAGERDISFNAVGPIDDLHLAMSSPGEPDAKATAQIDLTQPQLPYAAQWTLTWAEPMPLGNQVAALAATDLAVAGPVSGTVQGAVLGEHRADFSATLQGEGYSGLAVSGRLQWLAPELQISDVYFRDSGTDSELLLSGVAHAEIPWRVEGELHSAGFALPVSLAPGRLNGRLQFTAAGDETVWSVQVADMALDGEVAALPAHLEGAAGVSSEGALLPGSLTAVVNGAALDAQITKDEVRIEVSVDDLARWLPEGRGQLALSAEGGTKLTALKINGKATGLAYNDLKIGQADLRGEYDLPGAHFRVDLKAADIGTAERRFGAHLTTGGSVAAHQARVRLDGAVAGDLRLQGTFVEGQWRGTLAPAQLETAAGPWQLRDPVTLAYSAAEQEFSASPNCWYHSHFEVCAEQLIVGERGDVALAMAGNIRALEAALPPGMRLRGQVQGRATARWQPGQALQVEGLLSGENLQVVRRYGMGEQVRAHYEKIALHAKRQDSGELLLSGLVRRDGRDVVLLEGSLPSDQADAMQLGVKVDALNMTSFSPWFPQLSSLEGRLSGTAELAGPVTSPLVSADLSLVDGRVLMVTNPTELSDLALQLMLREGEGDIRGEAILGGGDVEFQGPLTVQPELTLQLAVTGGRHQVLMPPASELLVSETLEIGYAQRQLSISGEVMVHEGVLRHEQLPAGSVAISNDVVIVDAQGNALLNESPIAVDADVWVRVRDRFRVEGEAVQAVLGGDLKLVQTPTTPLQVFGTLNLLGGELRAYQQRLSIQRGTIAFSGPPENPELDIGAEREIRVDDVTVGARLTGTLDDAELEVYSNPVMSQSEAMSYLVRGRGLDAGAGADGTALALAVGADVVNRSGIVNELNRMPLISDVAFGTSGSEDDTAATVSGYIGNRIYVSYGVGIYEPINVFTARLYLQSRLWLEVVSRLESSVDLYYSFDIR
ncbi:hypothetical protein GCM10007052_11260 [Halioglobus japonicus]|uniref:Translocation and assembly module TamB C-terminal domain-containing protein n=1 Tax=Halioglobus japonicus TaxID=930805 RepID=A0AAP8MF51_9GAMM|nr:translocation/assembly module TamB domain-containing protein [Halioglobus japonicus]PLW86708.1 hypothetical protein C0029_09975 [Halioglobus japonicus]GHD11483.1 hypothetical protein GCM10007052_11260 [Halioglobus japonicus]